MPQYYILKQGKNTSQHIGNTERSKHCFFFRFLHLTFKKRTFKHKRTQRTFECFSSGCFHLSRISYAMDTMHR